MTGVNVSVALLGLGLALLPATAIADPTDEAPAGAQLDPDYGAGKAALEAKNWEAAIRSLSSAALRDTRNADIQNYLGYAYRHTGQLALAFKHYQRALDLNPRHRGAHEYAGEACLIVNDLAKAEEVGGGSAGEGVDALVVIADHAQFVAPAQPPLKQRGLQRVDVLVLIDREGQVPAANPGSGFRVLVVQADRQLNFSAIQQPG